MANKHQTRNAEASQFMLLLDSDDKMMDRSKNFLTLLARKLMFIMDLNPRNYLARIEQWLRRRFSQDQDSVGKISTFRNNFQKEVAQEAMTPHVFQKFTQSVGATQVTLTVKLDFDDGRHPVETTVTYRNPTPEEEKDE